MAFIRMFLPPANHLLGFVLVIKLSRIHLADAAKFDGGWGIGTAIKIVGKADWIPTTSTSLTSSMCIKIRSQHYRQTLLGLPNQIFVKTLPLQSANRCLLYGTSRIHPAYANALIDIREDKIGKERAGRPHFASKAA